MILILSVLPYYYVLSAVAKDGPVMIIAECPPWLKVMSRAGKFVQSDELHSDQYKVQ